MPTLLSLPNELLLRVIVELDIGDIEPFSMSCKFMKLLAADRLEKHLDNKAKFSSVKIAWPPEQHGFFPFSPYYLLKSFLLDDDIALYPSTMYIGDTATASEGLVVPDIFKEFEGLEEQVVAKVSHIRQCLRPLESHRITQQWIASIAKGDAVSIVALLPTLLPNLKTLWLSDQLLFGGSLYFNHALEGLATKDHQQTLNVLTQMSELHLEGFRGDFIGPFLFLPSMRMIKAHRVQWSHYSWPKGVPASNVKEIAFERSEIGIKCLQGCLHRIKSLTVFIYDYVRMPGGNLRWQPRRVVQALQRHSRKSLVHLELTGEPNELSYRVVDGEPFIDTLRSFDVLKSVRLMAMMLFTVVDGLAVDEQGNSLNPANPEMVQLESPVVPKRLVDVLPASITKFQLVGVVSNEEARDMFEDLPKLRRERLPNLSEIVLEDNDPLDQETKDLCKEAGIRLKSLKRVVNGYQRIYAITKPVLQVNDGDDHSATV